MIPGQGERQWDSRPARWLGASCALGALLAIACYQAIGRRYYDGYHVPAGRGMDRLPLPEALHLVLFGVFGLAVLLGLARALVATRLPEALLARARGGLRRGAFGLPLLFALVSFSGSLAIAHFVLRHTAVADDEHVYHFIAQTLRTGSLTAPSPGSDLEFYAEQFVVLDAHVRYGKYLPGQPLLLAMGQLAGAEQLVVPLTTAVTVLLVFALGLRLFDPTTAVLAAALFAFSPQVVLTSATLLSQPASALWVTVGVLGLAGERRSPGSPRSLLLAGTGFGLAILTRPMPGVLCAAAALAWVAWTSRNGWRPSYRRLLWLVLPLVAAAGLVMLVNALQAGDPMTSGAGAFQADAGHGWLLDTLARLRFAARSLSLVGSVARLDPWFLGWPAALLLCLLAPAGLPRRLLAWFVVPCLLYRVLVPKLGVGTTGSLYLHEALPLLSLLAAAGLVRLARGQVRCLPRVTPRAVLVLLLAGAVVSLTMFVPPKLRDLAGNAAAQLTLPALLRQHGVHHALVFHNQVVPSWVELGWAYFPPINSPSLDDDVLYMRLPFGTDGLRRALEFWRRRYPDRSAWVHLWVPGSPPRLLPMMQYVDGVQRGTLPVAMPAKEAAGGSR